MANTLKLTMDVVEAQILLIWLKEVSDTTFTDLPTRQAMLDFKGRILYAVKAQGLPLTISEDDFGDFT